MKTNKLSHVDSAGQPRMVDVSAKLPTVRTARACAEVVLPREALKLVSGGDVMSAKGPVFQTAIIAGTMAAKRTSDLIPFCHPLPVEGCRFETKLRDRVATITCEVKTTHKTGVEMEALTGATVAALTVYDMLKALSHDIEIRSIRLIEKRGGKSDFAERA